MLVMKRWTNSMTRKNFLFVFTVVACFSTGTWAQVSNKEVPNKEKVIAGAERAFEKFAKAYVGPAPGCAAAVSLNGETVFEKAFGLADLEHNVQNTRSEEHTSELQSQSNLVCRLLLEKTKRPARPTR